MHQGHIVHNMKKTMTERASANKKAYCQCPSQADGIRLSRRWVPCSKPDAFDDDDLMLPARVFTSRVGKTPKARSAASSGTARSSLAIRESRRIRTSKLPNSLQAISP